RLRRRLPAAGRPSGGAPAPARPLRGRPRARGAAPDADLRRAAHRELPSRPPARRPRSRPPVRPPLAGSRFPAELGPGDRRRAPRPLGRGHPLLFHPPLLARPVDEPRREAPRFPRRTLLRAGPAAYGRARGGRPAAPALAPPPLPRHP